MYRIDFTATVKKSVVLTLFALFLLGCIFSLMVGSTFHIAEPPDEYLGLPNNAETAEERCAFLTALGYEPDITGEEMQEFTIPAVFSDVYNNYNDIQKQSGGDLTLYKTADCTRYTYPDGDTGYRLNLIVYGGRIIGGDRCSPALDGDMTALGQ